MAKKMKRLTALFLALALCAGQLAIPAAATADGTPSGDAAPSIEVTVDAETGAVTTTTTSTSPDTGATTTTTTTSADNGTGDYSSTSVTTGTDTSDTATAFSQTTKTESTWSSQDTKETQIETGDADTEKSTTTVIEVAGSEESTDKIYSDKSTGIQTYSGSDSGEETTTTTGTTTEIITQKDALLNTSTSGPNTTKDGELVEGGWSGPASTDKEDPEWELVDKEDNDYQETTEHEKTDNGSTSIDVDPLETKDVTLTFNSGNDYQDSETLEISIEDALANNISNTEGQKEGDYIVSLQKDKDGNLIGYTLTKYSNETDNKLEDAEIVSGGEPNEGTATTTTTITAPIDPDTNKAYEVTDQEPIMENGVQVGVKTVEKVTDENGDYYVITKEIWEKKENNGELEDVTPDDIPEDSYTPPEKPEAPAPVTVGGLTTTVTVEEVLDGNGNIGYRTTTRVTDTAGNEVSRESETIFGTYTSHSSNIERFPEYDKITTTTVTTVRGTLHTKEYSETETGTKTVVNTRDVTQEIYQLVETDDGLYFLFEGKMYQVQAITSNENDVPSQGEVHVSSINPVDISKTPSGDGKIDEDTDLRNPHYNDYEGVTNNNITADYDYKYVGYGIESSITADTGSNGGNGTLVHQFKLVDKDGKTHYVLCADISTTAYRGVDYSMKNVNDASYYDSDAAEKISAIALNGYWGTAEGTVGSLSQVIAFLKANSNLDDTLLEGLTEGEALTATQAAIWYYGHSGSSVLNKTDATGMQYTGSTSTSGSWTFMNASSNETARINALYQALINIDTNTVTNNSTELLTTDNFATETQLVIKEKVTDLSGEVQTDANNNELYLADLTFTVDVKKSDLTGNLIVTVTDENGNVLAKEQLATTDSNLVGKMLADGSVSETEHTYTIENLKLPEGVKFTLNLSGTQNLAEGVYLYSAAVYSDSQTFVGIGSGTHEVNLSVAMEFSVTDPTAKIKHTTEEWTEEEVDQEFYKKVTNYQQQKLDTTTTEQVTVVTETYGTAVRTNETKKITEKLRDWNYNYLYSLTTIWGDDGNEGDEGGSRKGFNILDEDVPLANAPKTGDISLLWAVISGLSLGGMFMLRKRKDEE